MRFVSDYLSDRYSMSELCRSYGISRPCGYKWVARYEAGKSFEDLSSAPREPGNATSAEIEELVLKLRRENPTWGARKLKSILDGSDAKKRIPVVSTIHAILKRHGQVGRVRRRRACPPYSQPLSHAKAPNDVWSIDFKGDIQTADGSRLKPFTVSDAFSRYLLFCDVLKENTRQGVEPALKRLFSEYGAPKAIRSDNGPPFATRGLAGMSKLSLELIQLGICVERIDPGKPQQNGRHERIHWTLKLETAKPPARTAAAQRRRFREFRRRYNNERPHEALEYRTPADFYEKSKRKPVRRVVSYPDSLEVRRVDVSGKFSWRGRSIKLGKAFIGLDIGFRPLPSGLVDVWFLDVQLGVLDPPRKKVFDLPRTVKV